MYPDSWIYRGYASCNFDLWWNQNDGQDNDLRKTTLLEVDFLCTDGFNWENLPHSFVIQRQILINGNVFVAHLLNLPLNTQRPHYRSQHAGKWNLISAHERQPIYSAPSYYPRPVLAFGYYRCLRLSVCVFVHPSICVCGKHLLVRAITHHPFKLRSPNLYQMCKRPWLRSLLFLGVIDLDRQVNFKV